jgi:hypothetical protein
MCDKLDTLVIRMSGVQPMKALPNFRECDCSNEKACRILRVPPGNVPGIGPWFFRLAYRIRVQHEIHGRNSKDFTKSSGILGGSQSVVRRTESSHALRFFRRWRGVPFRHHARIRRLDAFPPLVCCSSQPNKSRASPADNFFTFWTASSTVLIGPILVGKPVCRKPLPHSASIRQLPRSEVLGKKMAAPRSPLPAPRSAFSALPSTLRSPVHPSVRKWA